jgi:hypothetical protein
MTPWKLTRIATHFNGKPSRAFKATKALKSLGRYPRSPSSKLKETGSLLPGPRVKDLPEPRDDLVLLIVPTIVCELGPIVAEGCVIRTRESPVVGYQHVNAGHPADQEFQFFLAECGNEGLGNNLIKTIDESVELSFDRADNLVTNNKIDVLAFVLFSHTYIGATGLEIYVDDFTKPFFVD